MSAWTNPIVIQDDPSDDVEILEYPFNYIVFQEDNGGDLVDYYWGI